MFQIKKTDGRSTTYDRAAFLSCQAQYALQRNRYPDPIGGLFSYQTWNGMDGFWQHGLAIEALTNAMIYGNNTRYMSVVKVLSYKNSVMSLVHRFYSSSKQKYIYRLCKSR